MRQRKYAQAFKRRWVRVARRRARIKRLFPFTATLSFFSGPVPKADGAPTGTLLAKIALPSDWMGDTRKAGTWTGDANTGVIHV